MCYWFSNVRSASRRDVSISDRTEVLILSRSCWYRGGFYDVLSEEPNPEILGKSPENEEEDAAEPQFQGPTLMNQAGTYFPADTQELEDVRARLEKLLTPEDP